MPKFDVFLSHNSKDKPWVIKLKDDLQRYGVSVWLDQDEIRPGDLFARALEAGLANSGPSLWSSLRKRWPPAGWRKSITALCH